MGFKMTEREYKAILVNAAIGKTDNETANELGISSFTVSCTRRMINAVKRDDWETVARLLKQNQSATTVYWAAENCKKEVPEEIVRQIKGRSSARKIRSRVAKIEEVDTEPESDHLIAEITKISECLAKIAEATEAIRVKLEQ